MTVKVTMPALGESVVEGTVGKWLVAEGEWVETGKPVVEILTDKADSEVPATAAGKLVKHLVAEDAVVRVGEALCEIDDEAKAAESAAEGKATPTTAEQATALQPADTRPPDAERNTQPARRSAQAVAHGAPAAPQAPAVTKAPIGGPFVGSPAIRRMARERNIDLQASGAMAAGMRTRPGETPLDSPPQAPVGAKAPAVEGFGAFRPAPYRPQPGDEVVPFSRRRRIIADHMVYSKRVAPDVVTFAECDMHATARLREAHKAALKKEGVSLNYLAFVAAATCRALREHPELNARVLEDAYVKLHGIHLGVAVDTEQGLVVPVIRHADELTVRGLARAIDELALRARKGDLTPDDLAGKSFTISNPGRKGNLVGGAIISQPNVGILRLGVMKKRVVVVERDGEDLLAIHPMMQMALTYDHRVVDGVLANSFLYRVSELLEAGEFDL